MTTSPNSPHRHRALGDFTWQDQAVCRSRAHHPVDPELFFPEPDEMDKIHAAKALCAQCPVIRVCLDAALERSDTIGIRGGMTEEERQPLHERLPARLDHSRVNAALEGRDIHLTQAERQAVVRAAYLGGLTTEQLARILKVSTGHAAKLYRHARRAERNRATATTPDAGAQAGRDAFGAAA